MLFAEARCRVRPPVGIAQFVEGGAAKEGKTESPSRTQHAQRLGKGGDGVCEPLKDRGGDDKIEDVVPKRERLGITGFRSARRWVADVAPGEGKYLATYELAAAESDLTPLGADEFQRMLAANGVCTVKQVFAALFQRDVGQDNT